MSGSYFQPAEVGSFLRKDVHIRRHDLSHRCCSDLGPLRQSQFPIPDHPTLSGSGHSNGPLHAVTFGILKCSSGSDHSRQASHMGPAVSFSVPVTSVCGLTGTEDSSDGLLQVTPSLVVILVNLSARGHHAHTISDLFLFTDASAVG